MKALLLENIHANGVRLLTERGFEGETVKGALSEDDLIAALRGVDVLGIRSNTQLTGRVLAEAVVANGDHLHGTGAGAYQLKTLRLNQRCSACHAYGQCKPCQHTPAQKAGGNAAKCVQSHEANDGGSCPDHTAFVRGDYA